MFIFEGRWRSVTYIISLAVRRVVKVMSVEPEGMMDIEVCSYWRIMMRYGGAEHGRRCSLVCWSQVSD